MSFGWQYPAYYFTQICWMSNVSWCQGERTVEASGLGPSQTWFYCVSPLGWLWSVSFCYNKTLNFVPFPFRKLVVFFSFKLICLNMKFQLIFILLLKQLHNDSFVCSFAVLFPQFTFPILLVRFWSVVHLGVKILRVVIIVMYLSCRFVCRYSFQVNSVLGYF